tara:strand:+ start:2012 stop:2287 length:276 start_codon:yes stop_codon:yes gene_type:complete
MADDPTDDFVEEATLLLSNTVESVAIAQKLIDEATCLLSGYDDGTGFGWAEVGDKSARSYQELGERGYRRTSKLGIWYRHHPDHSNVLEVW